MSSARTTVRLRGNGVAVATAVRLLTMEGFDLVGVGEDSPPSSTPVIMLSDAALALLRDVFGRPDLFAARPRIERRIVAWGGGEAASYPHRAVVVTGADLMAELAAHPLARGGGDCFVTLHAARPFPEEALRRFGGREAIATIADLIPGTDEKACHVEATASGWLFLIPHGGGKAWLLGVGGKPDALLGESRLVAARIAELRPAAARFETAPNMLETMAGDDWLAMGTAAIRFDPISGDGTAQAVREAILASAVIAALRDGGDRAALFGHYRSMLIAAMRRHLQVSLPFYQRGGTSVWWREQADAIAQGHAWCTARLAAMPEPRFLLRGIQLVQRDLAA